MCEIGSIRHRMKEIISLSRVGARRRADDRLSGFFADSQPRHGGGGVQSLSFDIGCGTTLESDIEGPSVAIQPGITL